MDVYRKRPQTVVAYRWTGTFVVSDERPEVPDDLAQHFLGAVKMICVILSPMTWLPSIMDNLGNGHLIMPEQWVVVEPHGAVYVMTDEEFHVHYELDSSKVEQNALKDYGFSVTYPDGREI